MEAVLGWRILAQSKGSTTAGLGVSDLLIYWETENQVFIWNLLTFEWWHVHFKASCDFLAGQVNLIYDALWQLVSWCWSGCSLRLIVSLSRSPTQGPPSEVDCHSSLESIVKKGCFLKLNRSIKRSFICTPVFLIWLSDLQNVLLGVIEIYQNMIYAQLIGNARLWKVKNIYYWTHSRHYFILKCYFI